MSDPNKRGTKRKALSLLDKLEIIRRVGNENLKETRGNIAKDFEISESTISVLMANKEDIENQCKENKNLNRKRMKIGKYDQIESCLYEWFLEMRRNNVPLNGPLLCEKAVDFSNMLYQNNDFKPNSGWLHRFKKRYGINLHSICGESKKVDEDVVMSWVNRTLPNLVENYSPDCIYNADETGLFWKI
jgi:hypothetical protein